MLQIAWINTDSENTGETADVTIWDAIEHRIEVFHADTGVPVSAKQAEIVDRATELLQADGYIVHTIEPHTSGFAAIVETTAE
jgi:hypothetical protein